MTSGVRAKPHEHGETFRELFVAHAPMVWRAARHLGVAAADLEDICQEVFVVVHRRLPEFDLAGSADIRTWLYAICANVVRNHRRKAFRVRELSGDELPERAEAAAQEEAVERRRSAEWLARALAELDPDKRTVFVLHDLEGVPMRAITDAQGIPLQTGYSRLRLARERIEAKLALRGAEEEPQ